MRKLIYKVREIPIASETFVISHIAHAIKKGFSVSIIPDKVYSIETSSQADLIEETKLLEKVTPYTSPTIKSRRIKEVLLLFLRNPLILYYFIKLCSLYKKNTWEYLFYLKFYKQYTAQDVFHVHFAKAVGPLFHLKRIGFLKSKIVITFHGYDAYALPEGAALSALIKDYDRFVHAITVNSEFLKNQLISKGFTSDAITVVPVGIDTSYFTNKGKVKVPSATFRMISIGRLIPLKGHIYGIQVVKQLIDKGYNVHYTIIGYGELMETLIETIATLHLQDHVSLLGFQTQEEIKIALAESDVFLMTSTYDEEQRREALGIVSLEAQASGVPVIGFESGGFPETIDPGNTGFIVPDRDVHAMTAAVEKLMLDDDLLTGMKEKAMTHVKTHFDIQKVAEDYFKLYT